MRILAWPFIAAWGLISLILSAIGRVFAFGMGIAVAAIGVLLCMTLVGIVIGAPLCLFGMALIFRSVF